MTVKVEERPKAATTYEAGFRRWPMDQAGLIRAGRFAEVDTDNVVEEPEGLARSEFRCLVGALRIRLIHILKWDAQPDRRSTSWASTIHEQRSVYDDPLEENPCLKPRRAEALARAYRRARLAALIDTGLPEDRFPMDCHHGWEDILTRPFESDSAPPRR